MAISLNYQIYPRKAFHMDSVSKFHFRTPSQFFRCSSSSPSNKHSFSGSTHHDSLDPHAKPSKKTYLLPRNKKDGLSFSIPSYLRSKDADSLGSNSWLGNWDGTHGQNRPKRPQLAVNYKNKGDVSGSDSEQGTSTSTGGSTMERIVEKLKKFGYMDVAGEKDGKNGVMEKGSIGDIFYIEEGILPNTRGGFSKKFPFGDKSAVLDDSGEVKFPWEKNVFDEQRHSLDSRRNRSLAELTLPEPELRRLRNLALRIKNKTRITGAGITQEVVDTIHEKWKTSEIVRLKIEGAPALNMRRIHEILERKTGGLIIWRSGTSVSLYRGVTFEDPVQKMKKRYFEKNEVSNKPMSTTSSKIEQDSSKIRHSGRRTVAPQVSDVADQGNNNPESPPEVKYEDEIDELLDGLGQRYTDWPGDGPLPIDADLLPGVIPGFKPPFRLLPYGIRSTLGCKEATGLRRLARVLPPHFALGRGRHFQGLAIAMIKLWERSSIAKIALKRGVQLTTSERIAEDLKRLTGGMLLSRNKDYLVYYRGKDFLSSDVAEALLEKEGLGKTLLDEEEQARLGAVSFVSPRIEESDESGIAGTLKETLDADSKWAKRLDDDDRVKVMKEAEMWRHADLVRKLEKKLDFAERRLRKAERALSKVEESLNPADGSDEQDSLTDEERYMFRKLGLRMKAFLLLGRRGVFDGTVENMHLHWKYRELIKIMVKAQNIEEVKSIALSLEAESGGVLVSVDKVSKGYAIIVFRGRDYKRPPLLRPKNLLTKRKALARSIELQRHRDIMNHISALEARVNQLRCEIEQMAVVKDKGDEELYSKLESAYSTENEDSEVEDDEMYLPMYDSENETTYEITNLDEEAWPETNFPYDSSYNPDSEFEESYGQKGIGNS